MTPQPPNSLEIVVGVLLDIEDKLKHNTDFGLGTSDIEHILDDIAALYSASSEIEATVEKLLMDAPESYEDNDAPVDIEVWREKRKRGQLEADEEDSQEVNEVMDTLRGRDAD